MGDGIGYSLLGNGTDLSKLYPSGNTNIGFSAMTTTFYMQTIPNSHYWSDLLQIITSIDYHLNGLRRRKLPPEPNTYYAKSEMSKEDLLIGLHNCIKHGYKIKRFFEPEGGFIHPRFISIDQIIEYVENHEFNTLLDYTEFQAYLQNTIANGLNLTNGLKMEREHVYKRIDQERNYQDKEWGTRRTLDGTPDEEKPVAEWVNYIEYHVSKAKERIYHLDTNGATAELRKVAALAVRAMEIHGCPTRDVVGARGVAPLKGTQCCDGDCDCKK